jgi:ATP-dependent protease ClpP protease subunit
MKSNRSEIVLYGTVGASIWAEEYFTAKDVRDKLAKASGPLVVRLNSGGGSAPEGQAIYTALRDYPDDVEVVVDGVAASAGSLIAMAGDRITMRRGAWMLIHDPATMACGRGTAKDHEEVAAFLNKIGDAYAGVYAARSGKSRDEAREIMLAETVYLGAEAVDAGFADEYEDVEAAAPAVFDYRIYAHAPIAARAASECLGDVLRMEALAGVIAGKPRVQEVANMDDKQTAAAETPAVEMKAEAAKPVEAKEANQVEVTAEAPSMSAGQVSRLFEIGARVGVPVDQVSAVVAEAKTYEAAMEKITAAWAAKGGEDWHAKGAPTARILRDERETMREGMTMALSAQIDRRAPEDDRARPFMERSIVDMAAAYADYRGPLRSVGDKVDALRMAHSVSDFPAIFENALNKSLLARYTMAQPTYRQLAIRRDFNDFRPHPMVRTGDFPELREVAVEGGEFESGTFSESKETASVKAYARRIGISLRMLVDDDMNALSQVIADQGFSVARFEDKTFFDAFLIGSNADGPTLATTSRQVFNTTDLSKAGTASTIDEANLSIARAAIRKRKSLDGADLALTPSFLLVGPDRETVAQKIVGAINPESVATYNPFSGTLRVLVTAKITGNAWYLFCDPSEPGGACFVYGFLRGREAPRMRQDEPFGQLGISMSLEHFFGVAAIDFRGAFKNAGA